MTHDPTDQAIRELEDRRYQAMLDGDVTTLGELSSEHLVYTHSNAERDTKQSYLDKVASGHFTYHEIDHPIESLTVTGDCAVVVGQMRASVTNSGVLRSLDNASLAVWVKENGTWRLVAYQPTPNPR